MIDRNPDPYADPIPRLALRPRDAADSIGVSERTLATWTKERDIPHVKLNGVVMYPVRELQDWLSLNVKGGSQ